LLLVCGAVSLLAGDAGGSGAGSLTASESRRTARDVVAVASTTQLRHALDMARNVALVDHRYVDACPYAGARSCVAAVLPLSRSLAAAACRRELTFRRSKGTGAHHHSSSSNNGQHATSPTRRAQAAFADAQQPRKASKVALHRGRPSGIAGGAGGDGGRFGSGSGLAFTDTEADETDTSFGYVSASETIAHAAAAAEAAAATLRQHPAFLGGYSHQPDFAPAPGAAAASRSASDSYGHAAATPAQRERSSSVEREIDYTASAHSAGNAAAFHHVGMRAFSRGHTQHGPMSRGSGGGGGGGDGRTGSSSRPLTSPSVGNNTLQPLRPQTTGSNNGLPGSGGGSGQGSPGRPGRGSVSPPRAGRLQMQPMHTRERSAERDDHTASATAAATLRALHASPMVIKRGKRAADAAQESKEKEREASASASASASAAASAAAAANSSSWARRVMVAPAEPPLQLFATAGPPMTRSPQHAHMHAHSHALEESDAARMARAEAERQERLSATLRKLAQARKRDQARMAARTKQYIERLRARELEKAQYEAFARERESGWVGLSGGSAPSAPSAALLPLGPPSAAATAAAATAVPTAAAASYPMPIQVPRNAYFAVSNHIPVPTLAAYQTQHW
jgi:hypothetical protein